MASLISGFEYDIFISYRQKDNKGDGWVSEFVEALKTELESTFKEEVSVYFDINPHDGLLETHDVDASLKEKLKCLIFIPIISRTFCDPKSFAWEHEFIAFIELASQDQFGLKVKLPNGNVASRVLPIQIHEIASDDKAHIERELGGMLRPIEFIYKEQGVNRPLRSSEDHPDNNLNKTFYRNQINKVANATDEIICSLKNIQAAPGKEKTLNKEPLVEINKEESKQEQEKPVKITRPKLLSGIAILAILIIAIVLAYPKIFKSKDDLQKMTRTISVVNENGEKEIHKVFKDEYIANLAIFPFTNETSNSSENWLQYGILWAIQQDLLQFNYVNLGIDYYADHLQEQIKFAKNNNYPHFLTGAFRIADGIYEIKSRLYKTANGSVEAERIFKGSDFFSLIDSISLQTRIDLGISKNILNSSPDLPFTEYETSNFNAFRYWIKAIGSDSGFFYLHKSIELDSTYAINLVRRALINFYFQISYESALRDINQAMRHRQRLTEQNDILTKYLYYSILGESGKAITLGEMQHELQPKDIQLLRQLESSYEFNFMIDKSEKAAQQLTELVPDIPDYLNILANCCLLNGELNKGLEILEKLLKRDPENVNGLLLMGEIYLHKNDPETAKKSYQKAILLQPENEKNWSKIFDYIAYSQKSPVKNEFLEQFTGNYRFENSEMDIAFFIHNNHLIGKSKNQEPSFCYPVSGTQFTANNGINAFTFVKNNQHEVIKVIYDQVGQPTVIFWKEDSLILEAKNLLNKENNPEALSAFRKAYANNPDHYYLANFIRHLEFIQSQGYERIKPVLETCLGEYGNMKILKKNNVFYYENYEGFIYKILPLSQDQFMIPSFYNKQIQIIKKNNSIKGLKFIYRDGKEEFFSREK
jgi:tetratricopeptide (TPR) repeat protein